MGKNRLYFTESRNMDYNHSSLPHFDSKMAATWIESIMNFR